MVTTPSTSEMTLEAFLENPCDRTEWVNGELVKKGDMNAKTGRIQARLAYYWRNHFLTSGQGGEVYTETPCRTVGRVSCPDVTYLAPELVVQYGDFKILPHSFSLVGEIISPSDEAEEVFTKVREYLTSQCQEVWLVFPESQWVLVITSQHQELKTLRETVSTKSALLGFSVPVDELIA